MKDFLKFANSKGISTTTAEGYFKRVNNIMEPYILEERQLNVVTMPVLSRLFYDRIIFLADDVTPDSANILKAQLLYLDSIGDEDVKFFIDTRGGDVIAGLTLIDTMNFLGAEVSTYCMGMCASMGSVILSSGAPGKRYALPHGEVMLHQVSSVAEGQVSDMKIRLDHSQRLQTELYQILSKNTGKTVEEITADADRDHWLTATECLPGVYGPFGLIDKVIEKK